jgi:hypothetical protein
MTILAVWSLVTVAFGQVQDHAKGAHLGSHRILALQVPTNAVSTASWFPSNWCVLVQHCAMQQPTQC